MSSLPTVSEIGLQPEGPVLTRCVRPWDFRRVLDFIRSRLHQQWILRLQMEIPPWFSVHSGSLPRRFCQNATGQPSIFGVGGQERRGA
jgi:hypothetical protein